MDKRVIFAVAGSGKTTYIVNSLLADKRSLIITYTNNNYINLLQKITKKFDGHCPKNITLMTYYRFLYQFCYKPILSDDIGARGIIYKSNPNKFINQKSSKFYISSDGYFYSNRLAFFLENNVLNEIKKRIEVYYDELVIDEIQDIAGRDFNFLESLMSTNVNMLFVGDFYQHTFDTSRDGNVNQSLFDNRDTYESRFTSKGFIIDSTTLKNSWRCGKNICDFISKNLQIKISSNRTEDKTNIFFVTDNMKKEKILDDTNIVKLHFKECYKHGPGRRNWGESKGEDKYEDVCVMLNKTTARAHENNMLYNLTTGTRNKLYVAITRAHGNVYLIYEDNVK